MEAEAFEFATVGRFLRTSNKIWAPDQSAELSTDWITKAITTKRIAAGVRQPNKHRTGGAPDELHITQQPEQ
jgi:hypothetical protein